MHEVSADAEVERSAQTRGKPELLIELPGMFLDQIFGDQAIAAAQLGIAEISGRHGRTRIGAIVSADAQRAVQTGVVSIGLYQRAELECGRSRNIAEDAGPRVETVIILSRPEKIVVVAG